MVFDLRHVFNDVSSDVSYAGSAMRGEILGVERRRFWHDDEKLEIVMSVGVGGASVTQVAQRHEIRRQQIYAWRHDLKKKGLWSPDAGALFYPLDVPVADATGGKYVDCRWENRWVWDGAAWIVKCRWVAREFRWQEWRDDLFCAGSTR